MIRSGKAVHRLRWLWPVVLALALVVLPACGGPPEGEPVRFTVPQGSGLIAVADTLANRDIIRWPRVFRAYARFQGPGGSIKPGTYEMQRGTPWPEILNRLVAGDVVTVSIVIPEGWTAVQIAHRLADATGASADSLVQELLSEELAQQMEVPGPNLEGYLYPATYVFPAGVLPRQAVGAMVRRYKQAWTPELRARADSMGFDEREIVTLASIVEKEARRWTERDTIAAVFLNRLRINMPLQADPTVQYALGAHQTRLLYAHIDEVADHPYNTYRRRGLPPGPIASPSQAAIVATLNPADVDYLYFVARPDGSHIFTRSLAEHNRARVQVRRQLDAAGQPDAARQPDGR
ncbi:endolytic transglycosylase MltG [soil metagenome]